MSYLYLDTSALVKRYNHETGSNWVQQQMDPITGNIVIISEITMAEFAAALAAKQRAGVITATEQARALALFLSHCTSEYQLIAVSRNIIERAVQLTQQYKLRGYDAVQFASALIARNTLAAAGLPDFILLVADNDIYQAAHAEGFVAENPNQHP